ncbi:nuclear transport factor 2 family protein [Sphaerimonospora mesophila]|uniref:nuclear transport factor 2 family protein n=1 Tax=Sphaerimonospora mesophila TaxID=37483 RepID=UPI0006E1469C
MTTTTTTTPPAGEAADVWAAVTDIYAAFMDGDRARIDSHIHPDGTVWDAEVESLMFGRGDLDAHRDRRDAAPDAGPGPDALRCLEPVIDVWGDTALARYWLVVEGAGAARIRTTDVLRRSPEGWLVVHHHEQRWG